MKILLISGLLPKEEGENILSTSYALADLADNWKKSGAEVKIIRPVWIPAEGKFFALGKIKYKAVVINTIPTFRIPKIFRYDANPILGFLKKEDFSPDIIIAHMSHSIRLAFKISQKISAPLLAGIHAGDTRLIREKPDFLLPYLEKSQAVWARSLTVKKELLSLSNIKVIGNCFSGIDKEEFGEPEKLKMKFGEVDSKKIRLLSAGTLILLKNLDKVIDSLSYLKGVDFSYTIFGEGPEKNRLNGLIKDHGLEEKITIHPLIPRKELLEKMREAHFFIMPSIGETFGLSFVEAAAQGCIIIGLKGNGLDGIFIDGIEAIMLEKVSSSELAERLETLVMDREQMRKIQEESLKKVATMENSSLAGQQLDFIEKIVEGWKNH